MARRRSGSRDDEFAISVAAAGISGLAANGWDYLANVIRTNGLGQILGHGKLASQSGGQMAYLLTPGVVGDYNGDGTVDAADYVVWRKNAGTQAEYDTWRANFGATLITGSGGALPSAEPLSPAVPEPSSLMLAAVGILGLMFHHRRPRSGNGR